MLEYKDLEAGIMELRNRMNRILDSYPIEKEQPELMDEIQWTPYLDLLENKDEILIKMDLPGINPKEIDLSISGNILQIKGERNIIPDREDENYHFIEREYGKFNRRVNLPAPVKIENIKASYKDGVLTINMPKLEKEKSGKVKVSMEE